MAPPSRSGSHPGRALAAMGALILVMLIGITGSQTFNPSKWSGQFKVGLGLDLSSGTEVVLKAATTKGAPSSGAMQQAISVLESRVNGTGNSGAQVQQQGADLITVTVPGKAPQDVINLVSSTAKLAFRPVLLEGPYTATPPVTTPSTSPSAATSPSATPTGTSTARSGVSGSPSPTSSTSASAKASTNAVGARLAGQATPTATSTAKATATATARARRPRRARARRRRPRRARRRPSPTVTRPR